MSSVTGESKLKRIKKWSINVKTGKFKRGDILKKGCKGYNGYAIVLGEHFKEEEVVKDVRGLLRLEYLSILPIILNLKSVDIRTLLNTLSLYTLLKPPILESNRLLKNFTPLKVHATREGLYPDVIIFDKTGTVKSDGIKMNKLFLKGDPEIEGVIRKGMKWGGDGFSDKIVGGVGKVLGGRKWNGKIKNVDILFNNKIYNVTLGIGLCDSWIERECTKIAGDGDRSVSAIVRYENGKVVGKSVTRFTSKLRKDSYGTIKKLEEMDIECRMCTGDRVEAGVKCWRDLGYNITGVVRLKDNKKGDKLVVDVDGKVNKFKASLLEKGSWACTGSSLSYISNIKNIKVVGSASVEDKVMYVNKLKDFFGIVGMVGDGENDGEACEIADFSGSVLGGWGEREGWKKEEGEEKTMFNNF